MPPARFFAAIAVLASAFALSGCSFGGGGAAKSTGTLVKGGVLKLRTPEAELKPALETISARSTFVVPGSEAAAPIHIRPEPETTTAVESNASLRDAARASAADVDAAARTATTDAPSRTRAKKCFGGAIRTAAQKFATGFVPGHPPPETDVTMVQVASGCMQKAFPNQAPVAKAFSQALTNKMSERSEQVSKTEATAQDYVDWLVYTATLSAQADVVEAPADTTVDLSPVERSVDEMLVVMLHAHYGRLEVRQKHWTAAITNRRRVLKKLADLDVAPELRHSRKLLIRAMRTSRASDRKHDACGRCAAPLDRRATSEKRAFLRAFHPYFAKRYSGHIAHTDI